MRRIAKGALAALLLAGLSTGASWQAWAQSGNSYLRPIAKTHTIPPYPPESVAAQEQGLTVIEVHLTDQGVVDDCRIYRSSGSDRLDQAACAHVQAVWRWLPPTVDGKPIAISTRVSIQWDLKMAQQQQ